MTKEICLIFLKQKSGHICELFDKIDEQLYQYVQNTRKSYAYDEIRFGDEGWLVVIFRTNKGKHKDELTEVLDKLKDNIESFKILMLNELPLPR